MSKLELSGRQYVVFNPQNKDHRKWFAEFNKNRTWANCPVRFVIDNDHGDLITMIQRSLIQYYVDREFRGGLTKRPKDVIIKHQKEKL
jgi:hypothetical protein